MDFRVTADLLRPFGDLFNPVLDCGEVDVLCSHGDQQLAQPFDIAHLWRFDQIESEASRMLDSANSAEARLQLRDLLDRIALFRTPETG